MDYIDRATALHDALVELFSRYPAVPCMEEARKYGWVHRIDEAAPQWRRKALELALEGNSENAFRHAKGTGVPQEELDALKALLYG